MIPTSKELSVPCEECGAEIGVACTTSGGHRSRPHAPRREATLTENDRIQERYQKAIRTYEKTLDEIDSALANDPGDVEIKALTQRRMLAGQRMAAAKERFQLEQVAEQTRQNDLIEQRAGGGGSSGNGISRASNTPVPRAGARPKAN